MPRTIPLVAGLAKHMSRKLDPSREYFDLWCRHFDGGIVEIMSDADVAAACGHRGSRAVHTWRERIKALKAIGLIDYANAGARPYGIILLRHPHQVVDELRRTRPSVFPAGWWDIYTARLREIGAESLAAPAAA